MELHFVTQEGEKRKKINQRIALIEGQVEAGKVKPTEAQPLLESLRGGQIPSPKLPENFDLKTATRRIEGHPTQLAELITTGNFGSRWYERVKYEVDAGRDEVPILYRPIYDITEDETLPRSIPIERLGPAGVVFEEIFEGGEISWASLEASSDSVLIRHWGVGLKYTEDLVLYNEMFRIARMERRFGNAHNALMNHLHFSPILTASYSSANTTDGTALTSFKATASMEEKFARTLEAAMTAATDDPDNPRPGPYVLVTGTGAALTMRRALLAAPQQGFNIQASPIMDLITDVIVYRGWTGERAGVATTYSGVASTDAYLIDISNKSSDFQSYVKHNLRMQMGEGDMKRFIMKENLWDTRLGVYANPIRAVEKITLPTADSGDS